MCGVSYALIGKSYLSRSRSLPPFLRALSRSSSFFRDFLLGDPLRLLDRDLFLCFRLLLSETEKTKQILIQVGETYIKRWYLWSQFINPGHSHCVLLGHYYSVDFSWWFDRKISFFSLLSKNLLNDNNSKLHFAIWQKKLLLLNFVNINNSSNQSGGQTHGWILFKKKLYYISFYSIFCRFSCFHRERFAFTKIITIHGEKD